LGFGHFTQKEFLVCDVYFSFYGEAGDEEVEGSRLFHGDGGLFVQLPVLVVGEAARQKIQLFKNGPDQRSLRFGLLEKVRICDFTGTREPIIFARLCTVNSTESVPGNLKTASALRI